MSAFLQAGSVGLGVMGAAEEAKTNVGSALLDIGLMAASFASGPVGWAAAGIGLLKSFMPEDNRPLNERLAFLGGAFGPAGKEMTDTLFGDGSQWMGDGSSIASAGSAMALTGQMPSGQALDPNSPPSLSGSPEMNGSSAPDNGGALGLGGAATALGFGGLMMSNLGGKLGGIGKGAALGTAASALSGGDGGYNAPSMRSVFGNGGNPIFNGKTDQDKDREQLNMLSMKARSNAMGSRLSVGRSGSPMGMGSSPRGNSTPFVPSSPMHTDAFQGRMHIAKKNTRV